MYIRLYDFKESKITKSSLLIYSKINFFKRIDCSGKKKTLIFLEKNHFSLTQKILFITYFS